MDKLTVSWAGLIFTAIAKRDGRFLHQPGLFGFARREVGDRDCTLLFVGHAEDLSTVAVAGHPLWADAQVLRFNELHVLTGVPERIDRLQLCERVIRHVQPILNVADAPADEALAEAIRSYAWGGG